MHTNTIYLHLGVGGKNDRQRLDATLTQSFLLGRIHRIKPYLLRGRASHRRGGVSWGLLGLALGGALALQRQTGDCNHCRFHAQPVLGTRFDVSIRLVAAPRQDVSLVDAVFWLGEFPQVYFVPDDHQWEVFVGLLVENALIPPLGYLFYRGCVIDVIHQQRTVRASIK